MPRARAKSAASGRESFCQPGSRQRTGQQACDRDILDRDRAVVAGLVLPDAADLEEREMLLAVAGVVLGHIEQGGEQRAAQAADVRGERVAHRDLPGGVRRRVEEGGRGQAVRHDLLQTTGRQGAFQRA